MKRMTVVLLLFLTVGAGTGSMPAQTSFGRRLADSAFCLTLDPVTYDPSYYTIRYPGGDVPSGRGVCTDVIIRAYRRMGIDLQKEVHEDMCLHFALYPRKWGLNAPDPNIDHRRVPNLAVFFGRHGTRLLASDKASDYHPGDIVCWDLGGGTPHIGLVSAVKAKNGNRYMIIHNIGKGQVLEDCLFDFHITGHFRYGPRQPEYKGREG